MIVLEELIVGYRESTVNYCDWLILEAYRGILGEMSDSCVRHLDCEHEE